MSARSLRHRYLLVAAWVGVFLAPFSIASVLAESPEPNSSQIDVVFAGDIMLDCLPGKAVERGVDPFSNFTSILQDADFTVGNLECVIANGGTRLDKKYTFRAHPRCINLLTKYFDAVSLANNHTGDFGDDAFVEQLGLLKQAKLPAFGGGMNISQARQPLVVKVKDLRLAFLGYNEFKPRSFEATAESPGIAWSVDEIVLEDIQLAREKYQADIVIPFMHWGWEMETEPNDRQREFARKMIDAGADAIVGAHPHCTQGTDTYRGKPIIYSLGNFVFDGFEAGIGRRGWLLRLEIDRQGVRKWDTIVADINEEGIPKPNLKADSPEGEKS
jgi:poly-gamma-glutamate synthesis protein (capsule biosynthesis protein)